MKADITREIVMKRTFAIIAILVACGFSLRAHAIDIGKAVGSAIGGIQQVAEASKEITPSEEHYIGRAVAAMVLEKYPLVQSPALNEYLNKVGLVVAYHSDRPITYGGYHFAAVRSSDINAFACPGGLIFVTEGLMKAVKNEDELASVLGHEIAHVAERHGINAIKKSRWTKFGFYAAGEVGKQYSKSEVGQLVNEFQGVVSDVAKQVIQNGYSKKDEAEADRLGLEYASRSGYDPKAMASFIQGEIDKGLASNSGPFSSHPAHEKRLKAVNATIAQENLSGKAVAARTARFNLNLAALK
jgi:predicted Zn-dependent protease